MNLWYIRHGQTDLNKRALNQGTIGEALVVVLTYRPDLGYPQSAQQIRAGLQIPVILKDLFQTLKVRRMYLTHAAIVTPSLITVS